MQPFKLILGIFALCLAVFMLVPEKDKPIDFNSIYKVPSESSKARKEWNAKRLLNSEGVITKT